jgi:diphosphomevalonate decarboxylase
MYKNPNLLLEAYNLPEGGDIHWRSPSNIAIVKYWGKHGLQLPRNPSLSLTLSAAFTETLLSYEPKETISDELDLKFFFEGEENEAFGAKTRTFLESLNETFPFLRQLKLTIQTANSFPHSAGIASSASGMSALALCLCSLEDRLFGTLGDAEAYDQKASYLARLGSGSACRSIFPHASIWGKTAGISESSDEWGIAASEYMHPIFKNMHDDILIVSAKEKSVSSRAGHALMENNPYAEPRYAQARERLTTLLSAMKSGDMETFGNIAENEALTLHALMMTSNPSYLLMHANSLKVIEKVREYRKETKNPLYFTLDAGPNVHLLYPEDIISDVRGFIESELRPLCEGGYVIEDWVGDGPEEV